MHPNKNVQKLINIIIDDFFFFYSQTPLTVSSCWTPRPRRAAQISYISDINAWGDI